MLVGSSLTLGIEALLVPVRLITCCRARASSLMVSAAVRVPPAVGVKVTLTLQLPPGRTLESHVLVSAKSAASAPFTVIRLICTGAALGLLRRIVSGSLLVPTGSCPKEREWGKSAMTGMFKKRETALRVGVHAGL